MERSTFTVAINSLLGFMRSSKFPLETFFFYLFASYELSLKTSFVDDNIREKKTYDTGRNYVIPWKKDFSHKKQEKYALCNYCYTVKISDFYLFTERCKPAKWNKYIDLKVNL